MSGHYFPYLLAYEEIENAHVLALCGFYRHALIALRTTLEFGVIGAFFAVDDLEHINVQPWLRGDERTPTFELAVRGLNKLGRWAEFDRRFALTAQLRQLYGELGAYAHIRGYRYSHRALRLPNYNAFSSQGLELFASRLKETVQNVLTVMLIKYPLGLCPLPLDEKFGLDGPVGGFVQAHQVNLFKSVLPDDRAAYLEKMSEEDPDVKSVWEQINAMPDMTADEFEQQANELTKRWGHPEGQQDD
jgi:hypothetical protein